MTTFLIVTPVFNGQSYLIDNCQQMLTVKQQSPEVSVVWLIRDGKSRDHTLSLLRRWVSHHGYCHLRESKGLDIRIFSDRDSGMYDAINKGIDYAQQNGINYDIFCWLNADDRMADNSLNSMALTYHASGRDGWFIARGIDIDADGLVIANDPHKAIDIDQLRSGDFNYKGGQWIKAESCFFSQRTLQRLGGFNPKLRLAGDYDFILRAANLSEPHYADDCKSREFRRWEGQQSSSLIEYEIERKITWTQHRLNHRQTLANHPKCQQPIKQTIFFYPDYRNGNGYQEELYRGMNSYGYPTIEQLVNTEPKLREGEIFHIHWLNDIINRSPADAQRFWQWLREFILRSKASGATIIWTVHNISSHEKKNVALEEEIIRFLVQQCDRCHMHDQLAVYAFESRYGVLPWGRLRIAEHGAYPKVAAQRSARILNELGLLSSDAYVVIPGQVRRYKNLPLLTDGVAYIQDHAPDLIVCILGQFHPELSMQDSKPLRDQPNVRWLSYRLNDDQYSAFLQEAAFALLTYVDVSTSGAVIHCLSQACRVVAPRIGTIPSLVQSDDQGFLYTNNNRQSLFSAIKCAVNASTDKSEPNLITATVSHLDWSSILPRILSQ